MKLSFNRYGNLSSNGGQLNTETLKDICDCLDIANSLQLAPNEMRSDDFRLAMDWEKAANKREIFRLMLNHKSQFEPIIVELVAEISDSGACYEKVTNWSI
jgi:hypothetical protein